MADRVTGPFTVNRTEFYLSHSSVPGRLAVLLELLGQGEFRVARVSLRLHRLLVGFDSVITVENRDILGQSARDSR